MNGEAVILYHAPAANTDGDSLVFFRHSEVISAGNLFSTVSYPLIDVGKGGSIQGVIDGLNHILDIAVAEYRSQGGTWMIPGRGRLSDTADVASYRNMLVMIRDRVRDLKKKGMTLAAGEGGAAHPGLRRALRLHDGSMDDGHVYRGGVQEPPGEEIMRSLLSRLPLPLAAALLRRARRRPRTIRSVRRTRSARKSSSQGNWCSSSTANPHSFVHIEAPDANGRKQRWAVEWGGTAQLAQRRA